MDDESKVLDLTLSSEDEEGNKSRENSEDFYQSIDRRTRKSKTVLSGRQLKCTKKALDSSSEENNSKYKKDSKKHIKMSAQPASQGADSESDKDQQRTRLTDTDSVLSHSEKEKIRRAVKKGILQNLSSSKAKAEDQGDKYSDTAKLRSREMTSNKDSYESDDFSGGTTPYRAVVYRNIEKMEKLKKLNKINKKNLKRKKTKSSDDPASVPKSSDDPASVSTSSTHVSDYNSENLKSELWEASDGNSYFCYHFIFLHSVCTLKLRLLNIQLAFLFNFYAELSFDYLAK